ncbi:MAG TPA: CYTH domain-containing protein [Thermomicrobiales bacterium]|nr:CYTH domain-containing protein [Thermomicrobiales bacterium]
MTDTREVEAKFDIDPDGIRRLEDIAVIGDFRVTSRRNVSQDDLYFDTQNQALAAASASLRLRRKSDVAQMTFKGRRDIAISESEAHIASRLEDEQFVSSAVAARISAGIWHPEDDRLSPVARARIIAENEDMLPLARLENDRVVVMLSNDDGLELELAIDTCRGSRLSDGRVTRFHELELEAMSAGREALIAVACELQAIVPGVRPNHRTKLERVLQ